MHLCSVELENWRSYRHARFDFPIPDGNRNVILIKAPNEYGKTSFFEAITLGLFGRDGLRLVPRARPADYKSGAADRFKINYSNFLSKSLHHRAAEAGPAKCSVSIKVEDDAEAPIDLTRIWHFRKGGTHKPGDDQLKIFYGHERAPIKPPPGTEDQDQWFRDWIAQRFLHPNWAEFFLFDGEHVQRYADIEKSEQVRKSIEGLLGLNILRNLKFSLATYAQKQRTSVALPDDDTIKKVEVDIAIIQKDIACKQAIIDKAVEALPALEVEKDELTQAIGGRDATVERVGHLMKDEQRHRDEAARAMDALLKLIQEDLALAIAGFDLRNRTRETLEAEAVLERWESGRDEGAQNLDRFVLELKRQINDLDPPLIKKHRFAVVEAGKQAWNALWHPAPDGCAENYHHPSLKGLMRLHTIERLLSLDNHTEGELVGHVERFRVAVDQADVIKREYLEIESIAPETNRLVERLKVLSEEVGNYKAQKQEAERVIESKEGELSRRRAELGRYISSQKQGAPALSRADYADRYEILIQNILKDALPNEVGEVAAEMTKAWKAMAHLPGRVDRIEITPECAVKMLTADGEDIHLIDKSAGANQVFTQALILAITRVSGRTFPFVVDTPLARLSHSQRIGVLKTFTDRSGQVILLSTDEEVVGDKLDAIKERLIAIFELCVRNEKGIVVTSVHKINTEKLK